MTRAQQHQPGGPLTAAPMARPRGRAPDRAGPGRGAPAGTIVTPLTLGGLIADLLAQRPTRGPRREATLARRTLLDLVPAWALVLNGLAAAGSAVNLGVRGHWTLLAVSAGAAMVS